MEKAGLLKKAGLALFFLTLKCASGHAMGASEGKDACEIMGACIGKDACKGKGVCIISGACIVKGVCIVRVLV